MADRPHVVVFGLGRFGSAVAQTLTTLGHDVLAIDENPERVAGMRDQVTHVAQADSTDSLALEQLGVRDFDRAVVAIGADIEASILTTGALVDLGTCEIWAKAMTQAHARILERVGAHHVVFPEAQMGQRIAHLIAGDMLEFVALDADFALVEVAAPKALHGRSLADIGVREKHKVTVVCVKPAGGTFTHASPDTVLGEGDVIVVAGETRPVERFAELR